MVQGFVPEPLFFSVVPDSTLELLELNFQGFKKFNIKG
jgi:hypothetical protein